MLIAMRSSISGKVNERDINITQEQYDEWQKGEKLIQDIMPEVSPDDREFLISGITPEEWTKVFGSDEEEEE